MIFIGNNIPTPNPEPTAILILGIGKKVFGRCRRKEKDMKKIILTLLGVFFFTGIAQADVCMKIMRKEHWMSAWQQSDINKLTTEEFGEYEARTRPFDIIAIYQANRCSTPPPVQDPSSDMITVVVYGLAYEDALQYQDSYYDYSGELDPDTGEDAVYLKREHKFRIADGNLPGPLKNLFDSSSYLTFQWGDIRGFVENKQAGVIGE